MLTGVFGAVPKNIEKGLNQLEIKGRIESIQMTELLKPARILRRVQET